VTQQERARKQLFVTQQKKIIRGRPKVPAAKARSQFISTRVSGEEAKEIRAAVKGSGKKKTVWVRDALIQAARADASTFPK
jgi:hypothetical protein